MLCCAASLQQCLLLACSGTREAKARVLMRMTPGSGLALSVCGTGLKQELLSKEERAADGTSEQSTAAAPVPGMPPSYQTAGSLCNATISGQEISCEEARAGPGL